MIDFRSFRNPDPPRILEAWNQCLEGRGTAVLPSSLLLEYFSFAKPYFDPVGFILAEEDGRIVGFVHASFAAADDYNCLDPETGVICSLGVHPERRRQGLGSDLLKRGEQYLRDKGVKTILAGPMQDRSNPFTFGIYGGSGSAGFLDSYEGTASFFESNNYRPARTRLVFQKRLDQPLGIVDPRFNEYRDRFEIAANPLHTHWWNECILGPLEIHRFQLTDKETKKSFAHCSLWEMDTFNPGWQQYAVGIFDLQVDEDSRREGLARFLLTQIMRHLQEQFFSLMEIQVDQDNEAGIGLVGNLGFEQIDQGHQYQLDVSTPPD